MSKSEAPNPGAPRRAQSHLLGTEASICRVCQARGHDCGLRTRPCPRSASPSALCGLCPSGGAATYDVRRTVYAPKGTTINTQHQDFVVKQNNTGILPRRAPPRASPFRMNCVGAVAKERKELNVMSPRRAQNGRVPEGLGLRAGARKRRTRTSGGMILFVFSLHRKVSTLEHPSANDTSSISRHKLSIRNNIKTTVKTRLLVDVGSPGILRVYIWHTPGMRVCLSAITPHWGGFKN